MDTRQTIDQRLSKLEKAIGEIHQHHAEVTLQMKTDMMQEIKLLLSNRPTTTPIDVDNPVFTEHGESSTRPPPDAGTTPMMKVEMTRFDGHNTKGWLFKTEIYFNYYDLTDEQRFTMVSVNMEDAALSWFQAMFDNHQLSTWSRFRESLLQRFGPSPFHDLKGELMRLQQTGTVQEYYDQFEALVNQVERMQPNDLQSCFESGLRRDIRRDVRVLQPHSLDHAFHLAKIMEDRIADASMNHFYSSSPSQNYPPPPRPAPHFNSRYYPSPSPLSTRPPSIPRPNIHLQITNQQLNTLPQPHRPSASPSPPYIPSFSRPNEPRSPPLPIRRLTPTQMEE